MQVPHPMVEKWAPISVSPGNEVSTLGRIKGVGGKILELTPDKNTGYIRATLGLVGERKKYMVHRLVAGAFLANPGNKPVINHINGDPGDNCIENLEWVTIQENNERKVNPPKQQGRPRAVAHMSAKGGVIQTWNSANQAAEALEVSASAVSMCCRGENPTCAGIILTYLDQIDLPGEEWVEIEYEHILLAVSSLGRIKTKSGIKTYGNDRNGYLTISPDKKIVPVHRAVATAFCDRPDDCSIVNHKDGNPKNNYADNLEWCTASENAKHAVRTGLATSARAVRQYLPSGEYNDYVSISEAAKQTSVYRRSIGKACAGEVMKAGGFRWAFVPPATAAIAIAVPALQYTIADDDPIWVELGL